MYLRFTLSFRDVEELLAERGIEVTYESIRAGCSPSARNRTQAAGQTPEAAQTWHLDEMFVRVVASRCICGGPSMPKARSWTCSSSQAGHEGGSQAGWF
jgi:transposase-like protein